MNIYLLCKRYYTNKDLIGDRFGRLYHLPKRLVQLGHSVFVDAIDYRNSAGITIKDAGVLFHSIPAKPAKLPQFLWQAYCDARSKQLDVLIASGDIYIGYAGLQIARRLGLKFVFDVYDYYPAFRINRFPGARRIFNHTVKNADLVTCASQPLVQKMLAELNRNAVLIENGVDRTLFTTGDSVKARQNLNIPTDTPVIGYFGSITPARGPLLIAACGKLRDTKPDLGLILAGRVDKVDIKQPWINYFGELPQSSIPAFIQACDVVVVPYADDDFNSMSGACKIAEYLACGKPVVATRVSNHEQIFKEIPSALCNPDPDDMARAIAVQLENPRMASFPQALEWQAIGWKLHDALTTLV